MNSCILARLQFVQVGNAAPARNLQETRGLSGGYDFLLSPQQSPCSDERNVVGLERLTGDGAGVAITSGSSENAQRRGHIRAGASLPFTNAGGQSCRLTRMSEREGIVPRQLRPVGLAALHAPPSPGQEGQGQQHQHRGNQWQGIQRFGHGREFAHARARARHEFFVHRAAVLVGLFLGRGPSGPTRTVTQRSCS